MKKLSLKELNRVSLKEFKQQDKMPFVFVLDNVRSALNVGSVFRTSDAFAVEKMYLCGITAKPPHKEILKTAIGATDAVAWEYFSSTIEAIQELKKAGYIIIGIEQTNESLSLESFQLDKSKKYAIVLGNEVDGVSNEALALTNMCIEIPQFGTKHSLNVSVCAGVVIWDFLKQYRFLTNSIVKESL
jgi:23S rRNA (guanosine2251-2'-O)-methyltransferase